MGTWQPPIPAGALYSKAARQLGPAIALLGYCYDLIQRDGTLELRLKDAAGDMEESYQTVKRWWWALKDGPFFAEVVDRGRNGWHIRFKPVWVDWRILAARTPAHDEFSRSDEGTKNDLENEEVPECDAQGHFKDISRSDEGTKNDLHTNGIKVLMSTDQARDGGRIAPPPQASAETPPKRGTRDPNQQHPACAAFHQQTGYRPNRQQAAEIAETVTDVDAWRVAMAAWLGRGNRINDARGMLDWYREPERQKGRNHGRSIRQGAGKHFERATWTEDG